MPRPGLTAEKIEALRHDYFDGFGPYQACQRNKVSYETARTYFSKFDQAGGGRSRGDFRPSKHYLVPRYHGPDIIGQAITAAPQPIGSDWIGKTA